MIIADYAYEGALPNYSQDKNDSTNKHHANIAVAHC